MMETGAKIKTAVKPSTHWKLSFDIFFRNCKFRKFSVYKQWRIDQS